MPIGLIRCINEVQINDKQMRINENYKLRHKVPVLTMTIYVNYKRIDLSAYEIGNSLVLNTNFFCLHKFWRSWLMRTHTGTRSSLQLGIHIAPKKQDYRKSHFITNFVTSLFLQYIYIVIYMLFIKIKLS